MANRHPWESMQKYLQNVEMSEYWGGMIYIAVGERGETGG
jgi:demethylmenaquinone methyltransferase/2-methoxy-6-polyprenyl-1,4-benzoquinol methylase